MKHLLLLLTLFCSFSYAEKINIAVLELNGNGIDETDLIGLSNRLRTELFKTGEFTVIERSQMDLILQEQGFQQSGCTSSECAVDIGQMLNVQKMVAGSIDKVGNVYVADVRLIDVQSGEISRAASEDCIDCSIGQVLVNSLKNVSLQLANISLLSAAEQAEADLIKQEEENKRLKAEAKAAKQREKEKAKADEDARIAQEKELKRLEKEKKAELELYASDEKKQAKQQEKSEKPQADNKNMQLLLQVGGGITFTAASTAYIAPGGEFTFGFRSNRSVVRAHGSFYGSYGFIAGGGFSYGFDLLKKTNLLLAPSVQGGFWTGYYTFNEYDDEYDDYNMEDLYEYGGASILFEAGEKKVKFYIEPTIRFGQRSMEYSSNNYENDNIYYAYDDYFHARIIISSGITINLGK